MATIVATVGGSTSNSYVTQAEADTYFGGRFDPDLTWVSAAYPREALITAAAWLDTETWRGTIADADQALQWPRIGVTDRDGYTVSSTSIPQAIKDMQCELALVLLKDNEVLDQTGLEGFSEVKVGSLSVVPNGRAAATLPAYARRKVSWLLESPAPAQIRLERG